MVLLGALVNGVAACVGGLLGLLVGRKVTSELAEFLTVGMGLCVVLAGVQGMVVEGSVLLVTLAMTLGGTIGHLLDIDGAVKRLGDRIQAAAEQRFSGGGVSNISTGFVSSTLVICIGSMAIVGSMESGLQLNHTTLFTKALMDFVINLVMAASMGAGVVLSGVAVFAYEAILSLGASLLAGVLTQAVISSMLLVGSLLLFGLGLNMIGVSQIKTANFLPAMLLPVVLIPLLAPLGL